jgi:hypothetical protein
VPWIASTSSGPPANDLAVAEFTEKRVGDDNVQQLALSLMRLGQFPVVVNRGSDSKPTHKT